jgi:hypothetical protein
VTIYEKYGTITGPVIGVGPRRSQHGKPRYHMDDVGYTTLKSSVVRPMPTIANVDKTPVSPY